MCVKYFCYKWVKSSEYFYTIRQRLDFDKAIMSYLYEQWEKNRPCEHKSAYQVDSGDIFYNVCNDCGVLFLDDKYIK